jgi:hypothetical protein
MKAARLVIVWLWVIVPLGWGVMKSVQKAAPLFRNLAPAAVK